MFGELQKTGVAIIVSSATPPPITPPLNQYGHCFHDFIQDIIPQQNRAAVLFKNTRLQYTLQLIRTLYYALCF